MYSEPLSIATGKQEPLPSTKTPIQYDSSIGVAKPFQHKAFKLLSILHNSDALTIAPKGEIVITKIHFISNIMISRTAAS